MDDAKDQVTEAAQALSELGASKGGKARAKALSPEERRDIARRAAQKRWGVAETNTPKYTGVLQIGIPCAVLDDGTRVLSERGVVKALGGKRGGAHWRRRKADPTGANLPIYVSANNLKPFISNELLVALMNPKASQTEQGAKANWVEAILLPQICDVWLKARDAKALHPKQIHIAEKADILMRGLAHVGIVALVDEATGYQEVRDRQALQAILDAFLRKELAAWASRFPDEFYKEIFRLRGWEWKKLSSKRPRMVGKLTKDVIYERLAPGIIEELERRNPRNENWYRKDRHHQWLTDDVGVAALAQHLHAVIAFMRISQSWAQFYGMLNQAFPKRNDTLALPFMADPVT